MTTEEQNIQKHLFRRISENDPIAFKTIFDKYFDSIRLNALKFLKSEFWAEEVAQEVFLDLWDNRSGIGKVENPAGWLYKVSAFKCIDRARKHETEMRAQYQIYVQLLSHGAELQQNRLEKNAIRGVLDGAINKLPDQQKRALQLKMEGFNYHEIAEKMHISHNTVRNHLIRAYDALRKQIGDSDYLLALSWIFFEFF